MWLVVDPISVAVMVWIGEYRGFAVRVYFENINSDRDTKSFSGKVHYSWQKPDANIIRIWVKLL